ncbi:hypothetical protein DFH09DRAFT_291457 [Mycena vulgaris]|nr:hypothetical protein DFH09DRAFT_291457 [Mycena vulgaris]
MAYFNTDAEPFEESQGNRAPKTSPDELKAFYRDMERGDLERKLSKRKSASLWSRKSLRRTSTSQSQEQSQPASASSLTSPSKSSLVRGAADEAERSDSVPPMPLSRSIIPDLLKELPAWYSDNSHHHVRFNMHNPVGPRWYKNHHLVPPSNSRPATRPPSVFSPSFPAMASNGGLDRLEESSRMPVLSRSASHSPLPTPNSSQTRMEDQPRSRKNSQTAHDTVDLLDGSDPWGTAWHHQSPYDVGLSSNPSFEETQHAPPRSRVSSVTTAQNRRKTVTPSPLSQSTSAVHLHLPDGGQRLPRKLSKRRTVGIFGRLAASAPVSPVNAPESRGPSPDHLLAVQGPPSSFVPVVTSKKERRGSVLGRLAKRFSITRKPPVVAMEVVRQPSPVKRQPSPEKPHSPDPIKRVPPPLMHQESSFVVIPPQPEPSKVEADRSSSISFEADVAYTMGRLTVANPDPGSVESTPVQRELALSPEEEDQGLAGGHSRVATDQTSSSSVPDPSIMMQRTQSPESLVNFSRSPEPIAPSMSVLSHHSSERVVPAPAISRTASPLLPPAPEKPTGGSTNGHRSGRSSSGPRTSVERSSSPPNGMPSNHGRVQSPSPGHPVLDKPQPPPPSPPSPKLPAVPFPADYGPTPAPPPRELAREFPEMTADISPLSASSMLVNPPTPYTVDTLMPDEHEPMPPPVPSKRSSRDPSPSQVAVTGRETETFRLIRSSSGTVYASSETIRAAGEQWEVVESSNSRGKNKSQDRESESRREQRRQARADKEADPEQQKMRSERSRKRRSAEAGPSNSQSFPRSDASDRHHRSPIPDTLVPRQEDPRTNRPKRDEERERKSARKSADPKLNKPQPPPPPPAAPSRPLERNPSKSARPISEVPTAADMNTMRAREAWDMDRLWKARSLSGMEPNGLAAAPMPLAPVSNGKGAEDPPAIYGSSHTAFMVSTPFQQPSSSQIYHSMPPAPPPMAFPASYSSPGSYSSTNRASPVSPSDRTSNPLSPRTPLANPLPEPPRESPYEPAPLNLPEYWSKHAGVTTAH